MTYLEVLEPGTNLKKDSPFSSGLPFCHLAELNFGAYANVLNSFKNSLSETVKFENKEEVIQINNEYEPIIPLNDVKSEFTVNETDSDPEINLKEKIESNVLDPDPAEVIDLYEEEAVSIKNDVFEQNLYKPEKVKNKKKKKRKENLKIEKFVINPSEAEKSGFIDWLFKFKPVDGSNSAKIALKKKKKRSKVEEEIERSVQRGEDIVSEQLALLYEKQKHYELALEMFQKLNLKYPEKSSYFAAKISELNSKIKND